MAGLGFIDWDLATNRVELSDGTCRLLGIGRDSAPTMNDQMVALVHPDDRHLVGENLQRGARGEKEYNIDHRMIRSDGSVLWVHAQAELIRDDAGRPMTMFGTIVDITARKKGELALQDSEERLRFTLEVTRIGIWDWDLRTDQWNANATYFQMLGYEPSVQSEHRRFWNERVHPEDREWVVQKMLAVRDQGPPEFHIEYRLRHADGSHRWISSLGRAIEFDERGRAVRMLGIRADVTERKMAEARLAESEARATHAQKLESIGLLTGGIAHDFNNLLTVVIGNAEQLAEELRGQPRLTQLAEIVRTAGERGADLTGRLLAFARRQALEPKLIEPSRIVAGMLALLRRTLGEPVAVEVAGDPQTWAVYIDPGQLEQAILNLCINARDAMPNGGDLRIETKNAVLSQESTAEDFEVEPGAYVIVAITDTGSGIPQDRLARVFDPFFTTKPVGKGTGLGLSMVYGFTKQSGGTVKIHSEMGVGTTVKLYLPRAHSEAAAAHPQEPVPALPARRGAEVILLVEDDTLVRNHAARLLKDLGYRVLLAANGFEALEIARGDQSIDLLFTDVMMAGGMSGPDLAARMFALRPRLPVLFTSGYTENAIVQQERVGSGALWLHKPYDRRALDDKVRQALATADHTG